MKKTNHIWLQVILLLSITIFYSSCSEDEPSPEAQINSGATIEEAIKHTTTDNFYALTDQNQLIAYDIENKISEAGMVTINGLQSNETILAIDFRPATGQLYGVSNQSLLYVINPMTGEATQIGTQPFSPAIDGMYVGFDFNPTVDRIRLVTNETQNLRLHPETGAVVAIDGNLNPGAPSVVAVAYTNSVAGATTTTLYDIDTESDKLYLQSPPNNGVLVEVGRLHVQATGEGGFDIAPDNSLAIAALFGRGGGVENQNESSEGNKYRFYSINLSTGKATNVGKSDYTIIGIAIPTF